MVNYVPINDMLTAVSFEFDDEEVLFGMSAEVTIRVPGTHAVFPYSTGGSSFSTFSAIRSSPGEVNYSGVLLGDTDVLKRKVFEKLGVTTSAVRMKILLPASGEVLAHLELYDFRIGVVGMSSRIVGNATMISGAVQITFRRFSNLPI